MIISAFSLADPGNLGSTFLLGRVPETDHLDPFDTASNLTDDFGLDGEDLGQLGEEL
jgi:hypothetical protein